MTTYEEGIGRIMYVTGALDRERPRDTNSPVVRLLLPSVFGAEVQTASAPRSYDQHVSHRGLTPRRLQSARESVGGFQKFGRTAHTTNGGTYSREKAVDIREGRKPSLVISTLGSLAVLMSLKLFFGGRPTDRADVD